MEKNGQRLMKGLYSIVVCFSMQHLLLLTHKRGLFLPMSFFITELMRNKNLSDKITDLEKQLCNI